MTTSPTPARVLGDVSPGFLNLDPTTRDLAEAASGYVGRTRLSGGLQLFAPDADPRAIGAAFYGRRLDAAGGFVADPNAFRQLVAAIHQQSAAFTDTLLGNRQHVQNLSTEGAFPVRDGVLVEVFYTGSSEPVDTSWTQLYDMEDYRQSTESHFDVATVGDAVYFRLYNKGERVELVSVSGTLDTVPFQDLGGGFQFSRNWERDNKLWKIPNGIRAMQTGYGNSLARIAYQVLTAAGVPVVARQGDAGDAVVVRDVKTVNEAARQIRAAVKASDGFVPANPQFRILYNGLAAGMAERVAAMFAADYGIANPDLGAVKLAGTFVPVDTDNVPEGGFHVVLPGHKIKGAIRDDLRVYEHFDPTTNQDSRIGWGRPAFVRGTTDQIRFVPGA